MSVDRTGKPPEVLDLAPLQDLKNLSVNGENLLEELVQSFLRSLSSTLVNLKTAVEANNYNQIGRITHSLKSNSGMVGAKKLSLLCAQLEEKANEKCMQDEIHTLWNEIEHVSKETTAALTEIVKNSD